MKTINYYRVKLFNGNFRIIGNKDFLEDVEILQINILLKHTQELHSGTVSVVRRREGAGRTFTIFGHIEVERRSDVSTSFDINCGIFVS